nr:hypothetical protein [Bacteroidales bacterium]
MKKTILILAVLLVALPGYSQLLKLGIKAGAETTTVPTYDFATGTNNITALEDASWGWHAGLFLRLKLGPVYLQPEAVFASTTFDYNVKTATTESVLEQKFNRLSVPVLVGVKLGPVRI